MLGYLTKAEEHANIARDINESMPIPNNNGIARDLDKFLIIFQII